MHLSSFLFAKRAVVVVILLVGGVQLRAQSAYQKALDSLCLSLLKVKVADRDFMTNRLHSDSLLGIHTHYKVYGPDTIRFEVEGKSILYMHYLHHICLLDLDAYTPDGVLEEGGLVVLSDTSHHIFANSKHRISGHGYFQRSELAFELPVGMDKEQFIACFKQAIRQRHKYRLVKKKKLAIRKYDFDYVNR